MLWVLVALAAAPPTQKVSIGAPTLTAVNVDPKLAEFYTEQLSQQLGYAGVRVVTSKEIAAVLSLERQRQLMGCNQDSSSCMAELAGALGVDGVLTGSVAKIVDSYQLNLKVSASGDGRLLATFSARTDDEEALFNQFTRAARDLARDLYGNLARGPAPEPIAAEVVASGGRPRKLSWVPAVLGLGFAVAGAVMFVLTEGEAKKLNPGDAGPITPLAEARAAASRGETYQLLAWLSTGLASACLVAAGAMFLFGGPQSSASVAVTFDGRSAGFALGGSLP